MPLDAPPADPEVPPDVLPEVPPLLEDVSLEPLLLGEEPEPDEDEELGELELGVEELPEDELELGDFDGVDALPDEDDELGELPLIEPEPELLLELRFDGSAEDEPAEEDESPARSQPYRPPTAMARGNRMNADFLSIGSSSEGWWEAP